MSIIQTTPAWQLDARIGETPYGHHLVISSYVPTARRPEHRVKFQATLTRDELLKLKAVVDEALAANMGALGVAQRRTDAGPVLAQGPFKP